VWDGMITHSRLNYLRNFSLAGAFRARWPTREETVYVSYAMPIGRTMQRVDSGCQLPAARSAAAGTLRTCAERGGTPVGARSVRPRRTVASLAISVAPKSLRQGLPGRV